MGQKSCTFPFIIYFISAIHVASSVLAPQLNCTEKTYYLNVLSLRKHVNTIWVAHLKLLIRAYCLLHDKMFVHLLRTYICKYIWSRGTGRYFALYYYCYLSWQLKKKLTPSLAMASYSRAQIFLRGMDQVAHESKLWKGSSGRIYYQLSYFKKN